MHPGPDGARKRGHPLMPETLFERMSRLAKEAESANERQLAATLASCRELGLEVVLNENLRPGEIRLEVGQLIWDRLLQLPEPPKPGFDLGGKDA